MPEPTVEAAKSSSSSASTRVSEFRSKFEKFGARSKKSESMEEQQQQRYKAEMDAHEVSRQLQRQLEDLQRTRDDERRQLLQRLEDQRTTLGNDVKELRDRNAAVSHTFPVNCSPLTQRWALVETGRPWPPHFRLLSNFRFTYDQRTYFASPAQRRVIPYHTHRRFGCPSRFSISESRSSCPERPHRTGPS